MWDGPTDPQIYAPLEVDARPLLRVMEDAERERGVELTPTHFVSRAIHAAVEAYPEVNGVIARGRLHLRETVDVWYNVALDGGDLFGAKIQAVEDKTVLDVKDELDRRARKVRAREDDNQGSLERTTERIPDPLLGFALQAADVLNFDLGLPLEWAGIEPDPWGTAMVTNLATFDLEVAYVPIPPPFRMPAVFAVGCIHDRVVPVDGEPTVRPTLPVSATLDHRYMSGAQAATLKRAFCGYLEDEVRLRRDAGLDPADARASEGAPPAAEAST
jgi:pyruvate dehydrogenase E2 component (dihydrolipoamide acetyltransferase)